MSFRCGKCGKPGANGAKPVLIATVTKDVQHPQRFDLLGNEIDRGGIGTQIVAQVFGHEECPAPVRKRKPRAPRVKTAA